MNKRPLQVAFMWHFHQPYYKNLEGVYQMPWVRFHAMKDYLDLLLIAEKYPKIRQTFNIVPSLALQIKDYAENDAKDIVWELSETPADQLDVSQRLQILNTFFLSYEPHMIFPYERYRELCERYKKFCSDEAALLKAFSTEDIRDLQVWYNLSWIGYTSRENPIFRRLFARGRDFTETDKTILFEAIRNNLQSILPRYKNAWEQGQIEITTSPFYHPILPLLIDSSIAAASSSDVELPDPPFRHPEDARSQIQKALEFMADNFGKTPHGMLPPEGGLSGDSLKMLARTGVKYVVSDELIYEKSTFANAPEYNLYLPHRWSKPGQAVTIFFRDCHISEAIAFIYGSWNTEDAVTDLIQRLHNIRQSIVDSIGEARLQNYLVTLLCDGENSWEYYPDGGKHFLEKLFEKISEDPLLKSCTFSDYLNEKSGTESLNHIHPGSRINGTFDIWIAGEEDRYAWKLLKEARDALVQAEKEGILTQEELQEAWEQIYIAEGSDWCWWYGDEHTSSQNVEFDVLFREHLMKVYEIIGEEIPASLYKTIKLNHFDRFAQVHPIMKIQPVIDGESTGAKEWSGAAIYDSDHISILSIPHAKRLIHKFYVGFDDRKLYVRIDFYDKPDLFYEILMMVKMPVDFNLIFSPLRGVVEKVKPDFRMTHREVLPPNFKMKSVFEAAIPFLQLGLQPGQTFAFQLQLRLFGKTIEKFPPKHIIELQIPENINE
jgi:alpha-amylase/alpha-mannosidase (GH57 family)